MTLNSSQLMTTSAASMCSRPLQRWRMVTTSPCLSCTTLPQHSIMAIIPCNSGLTLWLGQARPLLRLQPKSTMVLMMEVSELGQSLESLLQVSSLLSFSFPLYSTAKDGEKNNRDILLTLMMESTKIGWIHRQVRILTTDFMRLVFRHHLSFV